MKEHLETDIAVASFLTVRGFKLTHLKQLGPHRYGFSFADPDYTAAKEVDSYFAGANAEAKALLDTLRDLKDRLYATKGNRNGNDQYTHRNNPTA